MPASGGIPHTVTVSASASTCDSTLAGSARPSKQRLDAYFESTSGLSREELETVIPALAVRSYHLPGYSYWKDWFSYLANNHPVLGICCHHRLHPVRVGIRVLSLLGSIAFGLAATNIIWLYFQGHDDPTLLTLGAANVTDTVAATPVAGAAVSSVMGAPQGSSGGVQISLSMVVLWTIGGSAHALFDNTVWFIAACVCCLPRRHTQYARYKRFQKFGTFFVLVVAVLSAAVASLVVLLRAVAQTSGASVDMSGLDDQVDLGGVREASSFRFLISYCIELALALFVYYPLLAFTLFSGVLGCGRVPILGGRPYEIRCEERRKNKQTGRNGPDDWYLDEMP